MSTNNRSQGAQGEKTYFEQQRELVLQDVATVSTTIPPPQRHEHVLRVIQNLEQVLQNMNTLNRSLESVIAVRSSCSFQRSLYPSTILLASIAYLSRTDGIWNQIRKTSTDLAAKQVGNEFGQVEGLWSMFENVMAQQQQQQTHEEEAQTHTGAQDKAQAH